ncbi:Di-copper centre-containing protein [Coprinopsis marcescibilis]|uniref:Di-copper centre-containing protein n=1 Tax=Coprinopsis marcescibilis TaxID=230819 RepID=A0A5C3KUH1_COPMA|nr:Di-copper centre-containing protein [Coprinopsis marcescibilis]
MPRLRRNVDATRGSSAACPNPVTIADPLLPFVDYPAVKKAADAAISFFEARKASKNAKPDKALRCDKIRVRKEWRRLTRKEQKAYIKAEKCLIKTKTLGLTGNPDHTYHDDLTFAHGEGFFRYHAGAKFLPWHRWFVWMHGYSLEKLCGYTGPIPYWDYTLDAGPDVYNASVFSTDPEVGFGNGGSVPINEIGGRAGGFIVDNGAFANYRPNLPVPHYLVRNFTPDALYNPDNKFGVGVSDTFNQAARDRVMSATNFWDFETMIDGLDEPQFRSIHNSVHFLLGGDGQSFNWLEGTPFRGQVFGSNDPVFYLHHGNVDHVWWQWQNKQEEFQYGFSGKPDAADSVCDALPLNRLGPDVPIALALKTEWYPQCYTYES